MKKIILLFIFILPTMLFAQQELSWDFPVKPGTKEWKQTKSIEERFSICQIPDNVLNTISTDKLIDICVNYPLYYIVSSSENVITGLDKLESRFNGLPELASRQDCSKLLIKRYKQQVIPQKELTLNEQVKLVGSLRRLELVILYCTSGGINNKQLSIQLIKESLKKYEAKKEKPSIFSSHSYQVPLYILAKNLSNEFQTEFDNLSSSSIELRDFMQTATLKTKNIENEIVNLANTHFF